MLDEDEDWLHETSLKLETEDGVLAVPRPWRRRSASIIAFGLTYLRETLRIHHENAERQNAKSAK